MQWQRGFGWCLFVLLSTFAFLILPFGCSSGVDGPLIKFSASNQFPKAAEENGGETVAITMEALNKDGQAIADGSTIVLTTTLGTFKKGESINQISVTTTSGVATAQFFPSNVAGSAIITAKSEFGQNTLTLIILEDKTKEPVVEASKEEVVKDSGPPEPAPGDESSAIIPVKIEITVRDKKLKADGQEMTEISAKILEPKLSVKVMEGYKLVFRTTLGKLLDYNNRKPIPEEKVNGQGTGEYLVSYNKRGSYRAFLQAGIRAGTAIIEAELSNESFDGNARVPVSIVELGFLEFQKIDPDTIGTAGSGKEVTTVSVKVLDTNNDPFPEGTRVYFSLTNPVGGASVTTSEALTNDKGIAFTQVKSGVSTGSVTVKALVAIDVPPAISQCPAACNSDADCASCGYSCHLRKCKKTIQSLSPSIAIVGGRPSYRGMTLSCDDRNIGGFVGQVGSNVSNSINTNCSVRLGDRFTNKVGFPTQVLFMSEAGAIDASGATTAGTGGNPNAGTVRVSIRTQNPPPADVDPMSVPNVNNCKDPQCSQPQNNGYWLPYNCTKATNLGSSQTLYVEPWYTDRFGRVRNPRDGLVTVVAYTNGEEQFTDVNQNGRYDVGEPFVDLGEPYLDVNDNGKWDQRLPGLPNGEQFVDIPCTEEQVKNKQNGCKTVGVGNGRRDGPNGLWDVDTLIWKKTWILWTGCRKSIAAKINPTVNLRTCTAIPFQEGAYRLKASATNPLSSNASDSYNLDQYEKLKFDKAYVIEPGRPLESKFLWVDENLNPLTPASTANYQAIGANMNFVPNVPDLSSNNSTLFGFNIHTLETPTTGSAFVQETVIEPTTFYGVMYPRLWSHRVFMLDANAQRDAQAIPASLSAAIRVTTKGAGSLVGCNHSVTFNGSSF